MADVQKYSEVYQTRDQTAVLGLGDFWCACYLTMEKFQQTVMVNKLINILLYHIAKKKTQQKNNFPKIIVIVQGPICTLCD